MYLECAVRQPDSPESSGLDSLVDRVPKPRYPRPRNHVAERNGTRKSTILGQGHDGRGKEKPSRLFRVSDMAAGDSRQR